MLMSKQNRPIWSKKHPIRYIGFKSVSVKIKDIHEWEVSCNYALLVMTCNVCALKLSYVNVPSTICICKISYCESISNIRSIFFQTAIYLYSNFVNL